MKWAWVQQYQTLEKVYVLGRMRHDQKEFDQEEKLKLESNIKEPQSQKYARCALSIVPVQCTYYL